MGKQVSALMGKAAENSNSGYFTQDFKRKANQVFSWNEKPKFGITVFFWLLTGETPPIVTPSSWPVSRIGTHQLLGAAHFFSSKYRQKCFRT
jgi:hypothetical protein